jgi:uroporphyrinogen decarboxylase
VPLFETLIISGVDGTPAMSKFDLIKEVFLGNPVEQVPISLWKHHPEVDRTPEGLAKSDTEFHKRFDHDLLKISFFGHYPCIDFGCKAVYDGAVTGSTTLTEAAIHSVEDWETLEPLDVNEGEFGKQVRAVELIREYAHGRVPTMATVFDPTMVADKICDKQFTKYADEHPEVMHGALELITDVMVDFARATLEAGSDGLFIASQHSTLASVSDEQYNEFVYPYDNELISRVRRKAKFAVVHLHAREPDEEIRFDKIARMAGVDGINWEDQTSALSLAQGKKTARKAVFGGIDHNGIFRTGTPEEAEEQILKAIEEAGTRRLVVAPGCVITVDTPIENIQAVVDAVRAIDPFEGE